MPNDEHPPPREGEGKYRHRREGDPEGVFVETARRADAGISMFWRWGNMLVTLVGFGIIIGAFYTQFGGMREQIGEMRNEFSEFRRGYADMVRRGDLDHQELAHQKETIGDLKRENSELRAQVETMRNMREAYVYSNKPRGADQVAPP